MEIYYFNKDVSQVIHELALTTLSYVGAITLIVLVATGVYYIASNGDPAKQKRASKAIAYAIAGFVIIMLSYAILGEFNRVIAQ